MDDQFREGLAEALQMPAVELTPTTELTDTWDSLAIMTTIALIDQHYSVTLSPTELENCKTVGDVLVLAERA
jgi:acyl carrier protein